MVREDNEEWIFIEAYFQNVELSLFHGIVFILRRDTIRPQPHTLALEDIQRHFRATMLQAYLYNFQLALESWKSKLNVLNPHRGLRDFEKEYPLFVVVHDYDDRITCIYPDSKGMKRIMYMLILALFSDGTLMIVKRLQLDKMTFSMMEPHEKLLVDKFVKAIEERIDCRNQIRIIEMYFGIRKQFPKVPTFDKSVLALL